MTNFTSPSSDLKYYDHYSSNFLFKWKIFPHFLNCFLGNTVNGSVVRESFELFYALSKLVDKGELNLEIDNKSPCNDKAIKSSDKKKLAVSSLEQIDSTLEHGTSKIKPFNFFSIS